MGLFNFRKKEPKKLSECVSLNETIKTLASNNIISVPKDNNNAFGDSLDKLIDGGLPWGWLAHNRIFTESIEREYLHLLNAWVDARNKSPQELYCALKSFVLYMEDVEKICKAKGECFVFWFDEILAGKGYLEQRKQELKELSLNVEKLQKEYDQKQRLLSTLDIELLNLLQSNNGILQKDVYKYFDACIKSEIQSLLYEWDKSGKLKREKSGNTYKILL